jgi:hypothetical protein
MNKQFLTNSTISPSVSSSFRFPASSFRKSSNWLISLSRFLHCGLPVFRFSRISSLERSFENFFQRAYNQGQRRSISCEILVKNFSFIMSSSCSFRAFDPFHNQLVFNFFTIHKKFHQRINHKNDKYKKQR